MVLGRNEKLHLACAYEGREDDCPKECSKCAISIKTDGDIALASNRLNDAIKQYKKALFVEPKFAEAWCNLANAYGMKSEYHNALSAFNKALAIDSQYGKAMFGKAVTLRNLGKLDEAMTLANEILELYDDPTVVDFKTGLKKAGIRDTAGVYSLQRAIDAMTDKAYEIIVQNNLLDKDGQIHTIHEIDSKADFSSRIFLFCKRRYSSLGNEKVWSESILSSFYGSAYVALKYYQNSDELSNVDLFDYLSNNVDLEELDRNTERLLGIRGDDSQSEKVWNIVYSFVKASTPILKGVEPASDLDVAIRDASESAYVMGMLFAMRHHDQEEIKSKRSALNNALEKLAESTKDYNYTPPERSAMCYSIRLPDEVLLYFKCDGCGQGTSIKVHDHGGSEKEIIAQYKAIANEFTQLGYPATVQCYCNQCANRYFPSRNQYSTNNFVFSVSRPDCEKPINSFPQTHSFNDFQYKIALAFLRGSDTLIKLSEATDTKLSADAYLEHVHSVLGNVVTKIDGNNK